MPRNAKFDKNEIIEKAVDIVENKGIEFLTARSLGVALGSSARPIFTTFNNMDEVFEGVNAFAEKIYQSYVSKGLNEDIAFKGVGKAYIRFASEHPKLFQILFMNENKFLPDMNNVLKLIEGSYQKILDSITENYHVSEEFAKQLYLDMWIYSHGIAVLIATKTCKFSPNEISERLTTVFKGLIINGVKK